MSFKRGLITSLVVTLVVVSGLFSSTALTRVAADETPVTLNLGMNEYAFVLDGGPLNAPITLKTGTLYNLNISNSGQLVHEIWFGQNPMIQDGRIDGYSKGLFEGVDMAVTIKQGDKDPVEVDTKYLYEVA